MPVDDDSEENSDLEDDGTIEKDEITYEDLCSDATFPEGVGIADSDNGGWALLNGPILARIFHYLRSDLKSLVFASMTCKHWKAAVRFYKEVSMQVTLSSLGHSCTDTMLWNIMVGLKYILRVTLLGCFSFFLLI